MTTFTLTISVIVPVYNGARTISTCIESLLSQNYPSEAYEIIVVDNGSTDDTIGIVSKYPVKLFKCSQPGPAATRNFGIAQSKAEIIAFTDADCVADVNWLSELVLPYKNPDVGGVGGEIAAYVHNGGNDVERFSDEKPPLVNFISGKHEFLPHLYTANASYRRTLLNTVNGFNSNLITGEDVDLSWRFQLETHVKLEYMPQAIIYHRHRTSKLDLAKQYRQYGFGEIILDTIYQNYANYPRGRKYQIKQIIKQVVALPRYVASMVLWKIRQVRGKASPYQAAVPRLWFLIESNNILGKIEGLWVTRFMTSSGSVLKLDKTSLIKRLYPEVNE